MLATFTRKNAWGAGGTLEGNSDLLWYAIGVGQMMQHAITDPKDSSCHAIHLAPARSGEALPPRRKCRRFLPRLQAEVNASTRRGIFRRGTAAI